MEPLITTETNTITTKLDHETPKTTNVGKIKIPKTALSHSSSTASSPDSPLVVDPFKTDNYDDDDNKSVSSTDSSPSPKHDDHIKGSTIEAPCNQEMERPAYRIPSSAFARNESKADMDWSVASNESLFSIHEENGHPFWRSGELVSTGCDEQVASTSTTDHMFSYTAPQPRCAEVMKSRELGLLAVATMKEVIMENETINQIDFEIPLAMASQCSRGSSTSTKSFAFSSKAEGPQKDGSSRKHGSVGSIPEEQEHYQPQTQVTAKTEAEAETRRPEPQPAKNRDQKNDQAPTANAAHRRKWFPNFFSCCSL